MRAMPKPKKPAPKKGPPKKQAAAPAPSKPKRRAAADIAQADPSLFLPLTDGERADALRVLLDDARLRPMANVGRYRVISAEPMVVKPPDPMSGRRLARVVIYDYAGDRCVESYVDLDSGTIASLNQTHAQPMLAPDEEEQAVACALADKRVAEAVVAGSQALAVYQYWSKRQSDLAHHRRSAAVVLGRPRAAQPSLVVVVDIADNVVTDVILGDRW
jgi:hypothetical protein